MRTPSPSPPRPSAIDKVHREGARVLALVAASVMVAACAPRPETLSGAPRGEQLTVSRRTTVAIMGDPPFLCNKLNQNNSVPGIDALEELLHVGLTHADRYGVRGPRLAREVPTVENGLWRVAPDGSMEVTWRIRPDAAWHDGVPVTSDDLLFISQLEQDSELPVLANRVYQFIAQIEAPAVHCRPGTRFMIGFRATNGSARRTPCQSSTRIATSSRATIRGTTLMRTRRASSR